MKLNYILSGLTPEQAQEIIKFIDEIPAAIGVVDEVELILRKSALFKHYDLYLPQKRVRLNLPISIPGYELRLFYDGDATVLEIKKGDITLQVIMSPAPKES